jgi:hypothetical protein
MYYPLIERYISLYPQQSKSKAKSEGPGEKASGSDHGLWESKDRPEMWLTVEKAMEGGEDALKRLRDRGPSISASQTAAKPIPAAATPANRRATRRDKVAVKQSPKPEDDEDGDGRPREVDSDDESDGGFFEDD